MIRIIVVYLFKISYGIMFRVYRWGKMNYLISKGAKIGKVAFNGSFHFGGTPSNFIIKDGSTVNEGIYFQARDRIEIGSGVHLSPYVQFYTARLHEEIEKRHIHTAKPISVRNNVWIGANSIILGGVTIGENSIIGAHSLVNRDIPPNVMAAGVPVKIIKSIKK